MSRKNEKKSGKKAWEKRQRRNRTVIVLTLILLILLAVLVIIFVKGKKSATPEKAEPEVAEVVKEEKAPETENAESQENTEAKQEEEKKEQETVPERSDFAVQPGKPVGTTEESDEKIVYLTLDDGPSDKTQAVLDILDKYNAKATFFVTGIMPEYEDMIKVAYDKGHTIGMHTYSHDYASVYASVDAYFQDLDQISEVVERQIGYVPCFIRFPGGSSNTVSKKYTSGIMTQLAKMVQEKGFQYYDWNGSSGDGAVKTTEELIDQATSYESTNIIMLSHDSASKQNTVDALPTIIEYYQSQGYVFKALDRESFVAHHGINN